MMGDAATIRKAVEPCAEAVGFFSLEASTFRRNAKRFLAGEALSPSEASVLVSNVRRWA